jgi:hypothetical protein
MRRFVWQEKTSGSCRSGTSAERRIPVGLAQMAPLGCAKWLQLFPADMTEEWQVKNPSRIIFHLPFSCQRFVPGQSFGFRGGFQTPPQSAPRSQRNKEARGFYAFSEFFAVKSRVLQWALRSRISGSAGCGGSGPFKAVQGGSSQILARYPAPRQSAGADALRVVRWFRGSHPSAA